MDLSSVGGGASAMGGGGYTGMITGGINMYSDYMNKRKMRKIEQEQKNNARRAHQFNINEMEEAKTDLAHEADFGKADALGNAADRGVYRSSIPQGAAKEIDYQKGRRMDAIGRRQTFESANMDSTEKIWEWQSELEKNRKLMAQLNSLINGGLTGYMGAGA